MEEVLSERAESLGVTILRGNGFTGIAEQDEDSVTVQVGDSQTFRAKWLVGCDGGRSAVRKAAGFEFVGTEPAVTGYAVKCELDHPERLDVGFNLTKTGMYISMPGAAMHLVDFDGGAFHRTQEITQEHLQGVLDRVTGKTDVKITKVHLASTWTDRAKQTTKYRKGRVLVAGDAAHIHSPLGAQGLNAGLGDAMNLGWKLAATVRQEADSAEEARDLALLDTYESERHPIAEWVLEWTRAQVLTIQPDLYGSALQKIMRDVISTTDGTNLFVDRVWGLSQRYVLGDGQAYAHQLVGSSAPDFEFVDGSRVGPKMEEGRGLLIDFDDTVALKELVVKGIYGRRVDYLGTDVKDRLGLRALIVRPDGIVAWVAEDKAEPDMDAAMAALQRWFSC